MLVNILNISQYPHLWYHLCQQKVKSTVFLVNLGETCWKVSFWNKQRGHFGISFITTFLLSESPINAKKDYNSGVISKLFVGWHDQIHHFHCRTILKHAVSPYQPISDIIQWSPDRNLPPKNPHCQHQGPPAKPPSWIVLFTFQTCSARCTARSKSCGWTRQRASNGKEALELAPEPRKHQWWETKGNLRNGGNLMKKCWDFKAFKWL